MDSVPLPLSTRRAPGGHAPDRSTVGVGVPLTCTVKAKGAPATSPTLMLKQLGGVRDVLTTKTRSQRLTVPVEEFRAEHAIENRPAPCGSPASVPVSPPGPRPKTTPGGKWPVHLMLPVDGAVTVGLGSVIRKASPSKAL